MELHLGSRAGLTLWECITSSLLNIRCGAALPGTKPYLVPGRCPHSDRRLQSWYLACGSGETQRGASDYACRWKPSARVKGKHFTEQRRRSRRFGIGRTRMTALIRSSLSTSHSSVASAACFIRSVPEDDTWLARVVYPRNSVSTAAKWPTHVLFLTLLLLSVGVDVGVGVGGTIAKTSSRQCCLAGKHWALRRHESWPHHDL